MDKLLTRITKLLNLGTSDQPHEAAAAIAKAQALMAEHGLSSLDVQSHAVGSFTITSNVSVSKPKEFEVYLIQQIAAAFGGMVLWQNGNGRASGRYIVCAPKMYLQVIEHTIIVTRRKMMTARSDFIATLDEEMPRADKTIEADGFCLGWSFAVGRSVYAMAGVSEFKEAVKATHDGMVDNPEPKKMDEEAGILGRAIGFSVGSRESINRPVGSESQERIG